MRPRTVIVAGMLLGWAVALAAAPSPAAAQGKAAKAAAAAPNKGLGSRTAPVTIEVYSDFQCPACRALYAQTLRPLIDNYVAAGKVYLVHRDFPLENNHRYARLAARYVNAAARLGKFERVAEAIYGAQERWSVDGNLEPVVASALTAAEMKQVRRMVAEPGALDADIDQDLRQGGRIPIRQTPSVIVTHRGQVYPLPPGGVSYSLLRQFIDDLLRRG